jgi:hypothetical protein
VLLTRADCHLCEQMHAALRALARRVALPAIQELDVDTDEQLQRRYGLKIPVLLLDGSPVCRTQLDEAALLGALAQWQRAGGPSGPATPG